MGINETEADAERGLLQREVAELLNVSRPRVSQLLSAGHLRRDANGKITRAEVERCRREAPVAWAHPAQKGGRTSKQEIRARSIAYRWCRVADWMRKEGWGDLRNDQWRHLFEDLTAAMKRFNVEVQ